MNISKTITTVKDIQDLRKELTEIEMQILNETIRSIPYEAVLDFFLNNLDKSLIAIGAHLNGLNVFSSKSESGLKVYDEVDLQEVCDFFGLPGLDLCILKSLEKMDDLSLEFIYGDLIFPVIESKNNIESNYAFGSEFTAVLSYEYSLSCPLLINILIKRLHEYEDRVLKAVYEKYNLNEKGEILIMGNRFITMLVKAKDSFGLATIREMKDETFQVDFYEDCIENINGDDVAIYEELSESKMHVRDVKSIIEGINVVLDFWYLKKEVNFQGMHYCASISDAIDTFKEKCNDSDYFLFEM